jgi:hypothetical protein
MSESSGHAEIRKGRVVEEKQNSKLSLEMVLV